MLKKIFKGILYTILTILLTFTLLIVGLNAFKHPFYSQYYNIKKDLAYNQGLGDDFVSQGVCKIIIDEHEYYISSGYMSNGEPSRVYINNDNNYFYVNIKLDKDTYCYDHFGGITCTTDTVYITGEKEIYEIPLESFSHKSFKKSTFSGNKEPLEVMVKKTYKVDVDTSFIFADENDRYLFVGEFNYGPYVTKHDELVNNGTETYHAYINCYDISKLDSTKDNQDDALLYRFSVRDKVQGFAMGNGKIVLSTSWSVPSSTIYVYDIPTEFDKDNIYFLDDRYLVRSIKAPAMMEALDYCPIEKEFITLFESACNKYVFGKFFLANKIVGLKI